MLKHIVMWKLKPHAEGAGKAENALKVKALLETCGRRWITKPDFGREYHESQEAV